MKYDVFTFGETMLRLATLPNIPLEYSAQLHVTPGGAESNVAANLARLGWRAVWFSRLPDSPLGRLVTQSLRAHGVDTREVIFASDERMGLYFIEYGAAPRGIRVWYDRANSAASRMRPEDLPLDTIANSRWVHLTGITPALSASCAESVRMVFDHARANHIPVSFDVNYRALLWSSDAAAAALEPFCQDANVVLVALRDAVQLFGAPDQLEACAHALHERWGGIVAVTGGDEGAAVCDGGDVHTCKALPVTIVDRIGAGDAFTAGFIGTLLDGSGLPDALRFGTTLSALKLTMPGDIALVTRADVEALMDGGSRALQR